MIKYVDFSSKKNVSNSRLLKYILKYNNRQLKCEKQ